MDQFIFDAPCSYFDLRQDCLAQDENWFREVDSKYTFLQSERKKIDFKI